FVQNPFYRGGIVPVPFDSRREDIGTLGFVTLSVFFYVHHPNGKVGVVRFWNFSQSSLEQGFLKSSPLTAYHLEFRHSQDYGLFKISEIGSDKTDRFKPGDSTIGFVRLSDGYSEQVPFYFLSFFVMDHLVHDI